ncbi:MAG: SDR family oxidoreductase [Acidobacteria bacterium]|nr:SDR family oxidoreductase [Acidobacteriota bacterium]
MAGKLEGKVAVVTGGNSGIGLATAKEFAREGARVVITGRDRRTLDAAAQEIGGEVLALRSDAASLSDIDELFKAVGDRFGRLDVLFVNAGVAQFASVEETDEEFFDRTMDINFKGAYFTVKGALPLLAEGASVILNTSVVAHVGFPNASVYSASKAALLSLARTLSADLAGRRIRVNAVSPGPVETPIFGRAGLPEEAKQGFGEQVPLKRLGRPEEIAKAVLFLASQDSSFLVGTEIVADGGVIGLKVPDAANTREPARAEAA